MKILVSIDTYKVWSGKTTEVPTPSADLDPPVKSAMEHECEEKCSRKGVLP